MRYERLSGVGNGIAQSGFFSSILSSSTSVRRRRPEPLSSDIAISPVYRLRITLALAVLDLLGIASVVCLLPGLADHLLTGEEVVTLAAVAFVLVGQRAGFYSVASSGELRRAAAAAMRLVAVWFLAVVAATWIEGDIAIAWRSGVAVAAGGGIVVAGRLLFALLAAWRPARLIEQILLVSDDKSAADFIATGRLLGRQVETAGLIGIGSVAPPLPLAGQIELSDGCPARVQVVTTAACFNRRIDRIVMLKAGLGESSIVEIVRCLEMLSFEVLMVADAPALHGKRGSDPGFGIVLRDAAIGPWQLMLKRTLDLALSGLAVLFLLPCLLLIAALVRLDSPGPVLFRQTRLGFNNRPFTVLKFRTMRADAPAADGSIQASRGDARITRVGRILRELSLDELPQLFNVLNGSMSLVGPRPHPTELNRRFLSLIEGYAARHRIAPGITGWAQVNGFRGETRTTEMMENRVKFDLEYIKKRSLAFDVWILLRTVKAVINAKNAY
jgi:exopolysaccharide biosynthesis polyprenyl glycosylphosphotransferase